MLTLKTEERLLTRLKSLSELELETLLMEFRDHITQNKMSGMVERVFSYESIPDLQSQVKDLSDEVYDLERERDDLQEKCRDAVSSLRGLDLESDNLEDNIEGIIDDLS